MVRPYSLSVNGSSFGAPLSALGGVTVMPMRHPSHWGISPLFIISEAGLGKWLSSVYLTIHHSIFIVLVGSYVH